MEKHFLEINFAFSSDGKPEIYDFLKFHFSKILIELNETKIQLRLERLEPLNALFTNLGLEAKKIKKAMKEFAESRGVKKEGRIWFSEIPTKKLPQILIDYDLLFDLFFTDLIIKSKKFTFDMMNGFDNQILAIGEKNDLTQLIELTKKFLPQTSFEFVDKKEMIE